MNDMMLQIESGLHAIHARKKDWERLFEASESVNPFLSWEWNYYWASNYANPEEIRILVGELGGVVNCIIPLQMEGSKIVFMRNQDYADYGGFIFCKNLKSDHLKTIIGRLMQESRMLAFEAIRSDSLECNLIESLIGSESIQPVVTYMCDNPYVASNDNFDEYYKTRPKKLRQEIRTTENHLKRIGHYQFVEEVRGERYEKLLCKLADFHLKRQNGKIGGSILSSKKALDFFKRAPLHLTSSGCQLHMSAIVLNGRVISAALSIKSHSTLYYWIPSFETDIPKVSLGKLHIKLLIEKCHNQNMVFDFMGGDERYKYQWADSSLRVMNFYFFASKYGNMIYRVQRYVKNLLKRKFANNKFVKKARVIMSNQLW